MRNNNHINKLSNISRLNKKDIEYQNHNSTNDLLNKTYISPQKKDKKIDLKKSPIQNKIKSKLYKNPSIQFNNKSNLIKNNNLNIQNFSFKKNPINKSPINYNGAKNFENEHDIKSNPLREMIKKNLTIQTERKILNRSFIGNKKNFSKSPSYHVNNINSKKRNYKSNILNNSLSKT